jgi:hypothetical protein
MVVQQVTYPVVAQDQRSILQAVCLFGKHVCPGCAGVRLYGVFLRERFPCRQSRVSQGCRVWTWQTSTSCESATTATPVPVKQQLCLCASPSVYVRVDLQ